MSLALFIAIALGIPIATLVIGWLFMRAIELSANNERFRFALVATALLLEVALVTYDVMTDGWSIIRILLLALVVFVFVPLFRSRFFNDEVR